jgi:hypothetical protein
MMQTQQMMQIEHKLDPQSPEKAKSRQNPRKGKFQRL